MPQPLEELQNAPYGEIVSALADLAPSVLAARDHYQALAAQQRVLIAARTLREKDLVLGERVRLLGRFRRQKNPLALVAEPSFDLMFQVLNNEGKPVGEPQPEYMFDGFEKL